mmetsp:Transcript_43464/g.70529  ORF Transcript_43464/g.70529 Transcript_43464/m.70529 type:complete len:205 (+) Transcript_43464:86-700(+)|eukprot:CAMPEP_0184648842 /NCGR_PEP_ID=MMETSP0308-20130426/6084_1 /TAXON_ID=38269 /ORGANISM="Gloeochaete witrockiana, Strain SAG 46.84" /LENGTH=204 /DNA_ID=CAMNT_0027081079 /DNA_START=58 /DNA_END=672 /DNA_ORIENTATION=-
MATSEPKKRLSFDNIDPERARALLPVYEQSYVDNVDMNAIAPLFGTRLRGGPEYLNPEDYAEKKRSWGEQLTYYTGTAYFTGVVGGGLWGCAQGMRANSKANPRPPLKLRINTLLNSTGSRGAFLGNSLGVLAMMYSGLESGITSARGEEDIYNGIGAAALTGLLYKSTAGFRVAALAGLLGGSLGAAYVFAYMQLTKRTRPAF